ncbi:transporter substrate-binding domain-containing protein [Paucihalobacter sp.]|uniref:transporter substrate-binding domain-containing protein n=1 Tax=Paucihalobacter sp. TaxID=2850405 RepID=UPI002FE26F9C
MLESSSQQTDTTIVDFWNGNRSEIRKEYEHQVLHAILTVTISEFGPFEIKENTTEYPGLEESFVFSKQQHHLFVTIAGNQKFKSDDMIMIAKPIAKNLLGYRIPIIKLTDVDKFTSSSALSEIQALKNGIPVSWSDATIFRHNGYTVAEEGDFDDVFERLAKDKFHYTAFGANELQSVFKNQASKQIGLVVDKNLMFFYPFPLVFYINPKMPELANRIEAGLERIINSGELDKIFNSYYANIVSDLSLDKRQVFVLENPLIPVEFAQLKPDLSGL